MAGIVNQSGIIFRRIQALACDLGYPFSIIEAENVRDYTQSYYNYTGGIL